MAAYHTSLDAFPTPELERFITTRVVSGRYRTASGVVRAGLRLLEQAELRTPDTQQPTAQEQA